MLYSINGEDKANYKKMTLIINIIASILLVLVYPIAATSSAMSIASPFATLLFKLFCYLVLAYPVFCIVRGFIVCMSDNLDKSNYPNFTLEAEEIDNLFYTELKISPHLPNVNATYYDRVKSLEDKVDELAAWRRSLSK